MAEPRPAAAHLHTAYRPDIDGLRALAVLSVVFSHLGVPRFGGGFIGVDIFFVISGYLITVNVTRDIDRGRFSIVGFYERRIRRIFPALLAMLAATSVMAYLLLPPTDLYSYAQSVLAALFSYSNIYFWTQAGYFSATYTKFLLHTWSLGVEEQFYVVLPICLMLTGRNQRLTRWVVLIGGAVSFGLAVGLLLHHPDLDFFMPFTRAWELLCGSALALGMFPKPKLRWVREALAGLSVLTLAYCLLHYDTVTPFPGLTAMPPCFAAVALIAVGEAGPTTMSSFLGWRPFVWVGLISYSLYLWHWPVVLLLKLGLLPYIQVGKNSMYVTGTVVSLILAYVSWRFVEQPFRAGRWKKMTRTQIFQAAAVGAAALSLFAGVCLATRGVPSRFPPAGVAVGKYLLAPQQTRKDECFVELKPMGFQPSTCLAESATKKNILLLGDSHAAAIWWGLQQQMPNVNLMQANESGCPPVKGAKKYSICNWLMTYIYDTYLPAHPIDGVILTERWNSPDNLNGLAEALAWFRSHNIPVTIIGPVPEYTAPLPLLLALSAKWNDPTLAQRHRVTSSFTLDDQLRARVEAMPGVKYASAWKALCSQSDCAVYADRAAGVPMLIDDNHLSNGAAVYTVRRMQEMGELPR